MNNKSKSKIMIVDDNPQNLHVLCSTLDAIGYSLIATRDGSKALDALKTEKPDLILLDVLMPDMNGYEVCRILKQQPDTKDIPVIFLTVKNDEEDIIAGFEAGAVDYVKKPFNKAELLARIKTHIDLKKAIDEIKTLRGILPICSMCKKVRDDKGYWSQIEVYITDHSEAEFSHSICPECAKRHYPDLDIYES